MRKLGLLHLPSPDTALLLYALHAQELEALHQQADRQQALQCSDGLSEIQHTLAQRKDGDVSSAVSSVAFSNGGTSRI